MVVGGFGLGRTLDALLAGAITAPGSAYDRGVSRKQEAPPEIGAELARLRKLEQSLRAERERIRASAAAEVHQLQTALRETAARAAHREREVQHLRGEVQRGAPTGLSGLRRGGLRRAQRDTDATGAIERVRASFERERRQLEERARAVAQTEARQQKTQAELDTEGKRVAKATEELGEQRRLSSDLRAAEKRIAKLERQLDDHDRTKVALATASAELAALARVDHERREAEAALLAARAQPGTTGRESKKEVEAEMAALLARREQELERRADEDVARRRALLEQEAAADLDRRRDELEAEATATLARREQELVAQMSDDLVERRAELERVAAEEGKRVRADRGDLIERERADLREEILAREVELARREEVLAREEIQLSLVRRRIGDAERRLQERAWRTGPQQRRAPAPVAADAGEVNFSEGWRRLAGEQGGEEPDGSGWPGESW